MNPILVQILSSLAAVIGPLFVAGLSWLIVKATQWLQARTKNELIIGIIGRVGIFVETTVRSLEQTVVGELKRVSDDGVITAEEATQVKAAALANVKSLLGEKGLKELMRILGLNEGGVDKFLGDQVEAMVQRIQAAKAPVTAVVAGAPMADSVP